MKSLSLVQFRWLISLAVLLTALNISIYGMGSKDVSKVDDIVDISIEDMLNIEVSTASKKAEKSSDAPGIIEVITEQEIKAFGAVSLLDILDRAASIQPHSDYIFVQNLVAMRGDLQEQMDRHVLLLINGRPVRETKAGGLNNPVYTAFPIDIIERIEIVRGPGSVLYGTNAFSGVINIITKQNFEKSNLMLSLGGGSFGAFESSLASGLKIGKFKGVVGARFFSEDGWNYKAMTAYPGNIYPDLMADLNFGEKKLGLFTQLAYKGWQLTGFYANFDENALGLSPYPSSEVSNYGNRWFFDLGFHGKLSDKWETNLNLTLNEMRFTTRNTNTKQHTLDIYSWGYLGEASVSGNFSDSLDLIVGGVFDVRKNIDSDYTFERDYSQTHLAAYTQLNYKPFDRFKVIAGAQLNKPHEGDVDVVPRLGFLYSFRKGFSIKVLYGHAFRSPWPDEQLLEITSVLVGNPDLKPEKVATFDLQVSYQTEKARFSLTYFNSKTKDLILKVPGATAGSTYGNTPGFKSEGVEFEMKASPFKDFLLTGSAFFLDNQDPQSFSPTSMFKMGASYRTPFGLNMGLFLTHYGAPPENQGKVLNPPADPVNLLSLNLGFKLPGKLPLEIVLYAQNLLDDDYYFPEYVYNGTNTLPVAPGRAIYSKIILRL